MAYKILYSIYMQVPGHTYKSAAPAAGKEWIISTVSIDAPFNSTHGASSNTLNIYAEGNIAGGNSIFTGLDLSNSATENKRISILEGFTLSNAQNDSIDFDLKGSSTAPIFINIFGQEVDA